MNGIAKPIAPSVARSSNGVNAQYSTVLSTANTSATTGGAHFFENVIFSFFFAANQNTPVNTTSRMASLIKIAVPPDMRSVWHAAGVPVSTISQTGTRIRVELAADPRTCTRPIVVV